MASERVCPHTITLFNFIGEDMDGRAFYGVTALENVHVRRKEGTGATDTSSDSTRVHIFDLMYSADKPFISSRDWCSLPEEQRHQYWTLSPNGKDYFAIGAHQTLDGSIPSDIATFRITSVSRREMGRKRMWHWMIEAR